MATANRQDLFKITGQESLAAGMAFPLPDEAWLNAQQDRPSAPARVQLENRIECDVLVVGGGYAGCFAAIKAREQGASVVQVDKGFVGKSGLSPFATFYYLFNPAWGHKLDATMQCMNSMSEYVNNRYWSEKVITDSPAIYRDLLRYGITFKKEANGELYRDPITPGISDEIMYAHSARENGPSDRIPMMILRRHAEKIGVKIVDKVMITELLKQNERVVGAFGLPAQSFTPYLFLAKTTILCVGGSGFKPLGYPPLVGSTGDGEGMAYRAGAEITGKEFVDSHFSFVDAPSFIGRRGLPEELDRYLGIERRAPGVVGFPLANEAGNPLPVRPKEVTDYNFSYLENEYAVHAGQGPTYWKNADHLRQVAGSAANGMCIRKADGLWAADNNCGSTVPGLYAAGDALGTMQNGAVYYLRGASSGGCMVTGAIAGVAAAKEAAHMKRIALDETEIARVRHIVFMPIERHGGYSPRWVTQLLQNTTMPYFISMIKKANRLQAALTTIDFLQEHIVPALMARDPHELRLAHETKNMVLVAEMRLRSALFRTESRGNHYREEFPRRDDLNWLAWTKVVNQQGRMKLVKVPVPKEWRPDLSVPYRQRYPFPFPGEEIS